MKTIKYKISGYGSLLLEYDTYEEMLSGLQENVKKYPGCVPRISKIETQIFELKTPDFRSLLTE